MQFGTLIPIDGDDGWILSVIMLVANLLSLMVRQSACSPVDFPNIIFDVGESLIQLILDDSLLALGRPGGQCLNVAKLTR
jgi:hypothetical protein